MSGQTLQKAMVPLSGKAMAVYNSTGLQYYGHSDLLGSIRLGTTSGRAMYFDVAYAPFGETYAAAGTPDPTYTGRMNDTAHRQDTAGGLYDFPVREYSTQGRWPNPDPLGIGATCPKDPQSQNRYAYVRNNPMSYTDPTGAIIFPCDPFIDPSCIGRGGGGGCPPEDPFCNFCFQFPQLCLGIFFPPIFTGGGGGGNPENPRPFPWPLLPLGLFRTAGSGQCTESRNSKPLHPFGSLCSDVHDTKGNQAKFIEEWTCTGDWDCCKQLKAAYVNSCYDRGKGYFAVERWNWGTPVVHCCYLPWLVLETFSRGGP